MLKQESMMGEVAQKSPRISRNGGKQKQSYALKRRIFAIVSYRREVVCPKVDCLRFAVIEAGHSAVRSIDDRAFKQLALVS